MKDKILNIFRKMVKNFMKLPFYMKAAIIMVIGFIISVLTFEKIYIFNMLFTNIYLIAYWALLIYGVKAFVNMLKRIKRGK